MPKIKARRPARQLAALLAAATAALIALSGCGDGVGDDASGVPTLGDDTTSTTAAGGQDDAGQLEFERCMRDHGVEMGGGGAVQARPADGDGSNPLEDPEFAEAEEACRHLLGNVVISDGTAELDPETQDAMVAYARCMRAEGIEMPDPTDGGLIGQVGQDSFDPESEEYRTADSRCRHHLGDIVVDEERGQP